MTQISPNEQLPFLQPSAPEQETGPMVRVLLSSRPGGFSLTHTVVKALFERDRALFDEPFPVSEFQSHGRPMEEEWPNAVVQDDHIYFLNDRLSALRTDPWLLEQLDVQGSDAIHGKYCSQLKAVQVPLGVAWHIFEYEDGSEAVHENHRIWD